MIVFFSTRNANWLVIILALHRCLLVGTREGVLIADYAILLVWREFHGTAESVQGIQTLLKAIRFLRLHRLCVVVVFDLELGGLHENQVAALQTASILACKVLSMRTVLFDCECELTVEAIVVKIVNGLVSHAQICGLGPPVFGAHFACIRFLAKLN